MLVQHIAKTNAPVTARHAPAEQPVKPVMHPLTGDFDPVEAIHLGQANARLYGRNFSPDNIKILGKAEGMGFMEIWRWLEIDHPFPTIHNPEFSPFSSQHRGQRCGLDRPTGRAMFMREMKAKFILIIFNRLQRRQFNIGMAGEAARIQTPGVIAGLAMHDLLGQKPAMAATFTNPGPQPDDTISIALARDRANKGRAINGIGNRPVYHRVDPSLHQGWHPRKGTFQNIRHPVQIIRAERIGKGRINPTHAPCLAVLFIEPQEQTLLFLTAVIIRDRAAQQRHTVSGFSNLGDGFGDKILMLHRHHRMMHPHHRANFIHPIAARIDHDFGIDIAFFSMHGPAVISMLGQTGDRRMTIDFGPGLAGAAGQCLA